MPDNKTAKQPPSLIGKHFGEQTQKPACRIEGCSHPVLASHTDGLCVMHHARNKTGRMAQDGTYQPQKGKSLGRGRPSFLFEKNVAGKMHQKLDISLSEATGHIQALFEMVKETLVAGEDIKIPTLGIFKTRHKKPRRGRNPQTGERITLEARRVLTFKSSAILRKKLNNQENK